MKILGPKRKSEYIETAFQYIKHQKLVPINFYKGCGEQKGQQKIAHIFPIFVELATWFFWKNPSPFSFFVYRSNGIPKVFLILCHYGLICLAFTRDRNTVIIGF
jgi:hypothetical protein